MVRSATAARDKIIFFTFTIEHPQRQVLVQACSHKLLSVFITEAIEIADRQAGGSHVCVWFGQSDNRLAFITSLNSHKWNEIYASRLIACEVFPRSRAFS